MSRYIDIEPYEKDGWYLQKHYHNSYGEVIKTTPLVSVPTADAEPVKHGRWTGTNRNRYNDDEATCSICGATFASGYSNPSWWDYCPNCGARMDGGEND